MAAQQAPKTNKLFYLIAFVIPVAFFLLLELGLRAFDYGGDLRLFIPSQIDIGNDEYLVANLNVANRYFPEGYFTPVPPEDYFKKNKPDNGYRVFVMGGSTTASWPYPRNVLFSRILKQRLADAFPDREIEVVNTGIAAVNSFTLLDFIDEILAQQPDAILIYSGHNEFYGAFGAGSTQTVGQSRWLITGYLALSRLKLVQLIRDLVHSGKQVVSNNDLSSHGTLMSQMVGNNSIAYESEAYLNARNNFETNLQEIITRAKGAGVEVMVSELVSNLRDHPPFISIDEEGNHSAERMYVQAEELFQQQRYDEARQAYTTAKDHDGLRFRASEDFNNSIHKVASRHNVPVVPMKDYFEQASPHGIIGKELMLEHLHPNSDGYMLMSEAFFDTMRKQGFISKEWPTDGTKPSDFYRNNWPVTAFDRALGEIRIINLTDNYPYKPKNAGERTIANFVPQSIEEKLAFKTFKHEIGFTEAHIELAKHYESQDQNLLAYRELLALIASDPYMYNHYLTAADFLLKKRQFPQALPLLLQSTELKETGYAHKWIGQILLIMQRPNDAKPHLEKALVYFPEDPQIIYNLGFVKMVEEDFDGVLQSKELLQRFAPESTQLKNIEKLILEFSQKQE